MRLRRPGPSPRLVLPVGTALALAVFSTSTLAAADDVAPVNPHYRQAPAPAAPHGDVQTSDREPGWLVPDVAAPRPHDVAGSPALPAPRQAAPKPSAVTDLRRVGHVVSKGADYRRWDRVGPRGQQRIHVLSVDLRKKAVRVDHLGAGTVRSRARVTSMVARSGAFAGVNGDFFDIYDTGAALGVAATRRHGIRQGRLTGWNNAFYQVDGTYRIGELPLVARIRNRPNFHISQVNSPQIDRNGLGVYTSEWGTTSGTRVLPAGVRRTREVVIRGGKVRSNKRRLSTGAPIRGRVLVGTGTSAKLLKKLRVGTRVSVGFRLKGRPTMAIGGDRPLLLEGKRVVVDDRIMHPRTAVGIDRDGRRLLLVVVDGRQSFSRGATMVELADLMSELGAEDALNLDGGGSSAMVAPNRRGNVTVRNSPSDGQQRLVPNGIGLFAR